MNYTGGFILKMHADNPPVGCCDRQSATDQMTLVNSLLASNDYKDNHIQEVSVDPVSGTSKLSSIDNNGAIGAA